VFPRPSPLMQKISRDAHINYCLAASGCVEVTLHSWVQTHTSRYTWMYTDASSVYVLLHVNTIGGTQMCTTSNVLCADQNRRYQLLLVGCSANCIPCVDQCSLRMCLV